MSDWGKRFLARMEAAAARDQHILDDIEVAKKKITVKVVPALERDVKGNEIALAAIREVYNLLEADGEARQSNIEELKETEVLLEKAATMLEQAGFDFANIKTIAANDDIWLGHHLPTIKQALAVFSITPMDDGNISLFEQALDSLEKERFEDIAHAVKRSGEKREKGTE